MSNIIGGVYADEEDDAEPRSRLFDETEQDKLAYDDEQRALRDSLKAAAWGEDADSGNEGDAGGLVTRKERRKDEEVEETEDYIKWLKGEKLSRVVKSYLPYAPFLQCRS